MRKTAILSLALVAMLGSTLAEARGSRLRERLAERRAGGENNAPTIRPSETISYGSDPLQVLDFWAAQGTRTSKVPLIINVHGGGWKRGSKDTATGKWKPEHYPQQGYAFASINYRLVPEATVEQQAADVASAVRALIDRADRLGIDRRKIVLMGHSAGAHLVALVGTDERYLRGVGLSFGDVAGIIPNDGAAYDVPEQIADAGRMMLQTYTQAFGTDPARQRALSPTFHAAAPNVGEFLLLHVQREDGVRQAQELGSELRKAGTHVEFGSFPGTGLKGHAEINRSLGDPSYAATPVVDAWLQRVFGR